MRPRLDSFFLGTEQQLITFCCEKSVWSDSTLWRMIRSVWEIAELCPRDVGEQMAVDWDRLPPDLLAGYTGPIRFYSRERTDYDRHTDRVISTYPELRAYVDSCGPRSSTGLGDWSTEGRWTIYHLRDGRPPPWRWWP